MALKDGFRIKETSTTTGAGVITVNGAPATYLTILSEIGEGNTFLYQIFDANGIDWEVGLGTVTGATFTRSVIRSSNANALIVLTAGTHTIVNAPVPGRATGKVDYDHSELTNAHIAAYVETLDAGSITTGVLTLNLAVSNTFDVTLTENVTSLVISNPHADASTQSFTVVLKQDATGGRTFAFPASIKWAGGTAPTLSSGVSEIDVLTFITTDNGTTWLGML
ncbi:hypothetical protein KAU11_08120, partial [Candidatus Babeliales bacterium]|nr:hypothetical protein [Candidatus Babeliales bacterium]